MSSRPDSAATRLRSRRSIAHIPRSKMTSGLDKENATTDIGAAEAFGTTNKTATRDKKSRSKSLGPGGLDALQKSNGNRRKSTALFAPKSILKPTLPVSPVRSIPSFAETRRRTPAREASNQKGNNNDDARKEGVLIDFVASSQPPANVSDDKSNPFDTFNATSAIRDEMAATKERDEKERRQRERQNILEKREARRKSMANRRVSFAPEATLHTWNVVDIPDDSTASSAANSTRRASTLGAAQNQHNPASETQSSSDDEAESEFGFSPVRTQDLEQIRNNSAPSGGHQHTDLSDLSSSPFSGSSGSENEDTGAHGFVEEGEDGDSSGSDDGFDAESTAMSLDDMTARSAATMHSDVSSSSSSSARLNDALRQAAREAGTPGLDEDNGEMSMEIASEEITGAFQPWFKKGQNLDWEDLSAQVDYSKTSPNKDGAESDGINEDEDMSMDVTNVIGGILGKSPGRRKSAMRRQSSSQETNYDDQTMEMTNMIGGIAQMNPVQSQDDYDEDEDMTMEFTAAIGGLLSKGPSDPPPDKNTGQPSYPQISEISDRIDFEHDNESDQDVDMEMTNAVGGILPSGIDKAHAKMIMELETESGQLNSSPFQENVRQSPVKSPAKSPLFRVATVTSDDGSPSLATVKSRSSRRSSASGIPDTPGTPQSTSLGRSSTRKPSTPPNSTPEPKPHTPSKTPPSASVSFRSASPKKLFRPDIKQSAERRKSLRRSIFEQNSLTGQTTPRIVLQPNKGRRSSGLGIDKEGLGSPRVAELLDKRLSLGDSTPPFIIPQERQQAGVRFEDPLKLQADEEREREEEELREDGHLLQPNAANGDVTSNLRDMISSLSPKKTRIGSRKSLHVGAARGILGKRPIELDLDEEESMNSPKRLRGHDVSPVKGIKLPAPTPYDQRPRRSIRSPVRRAQSSSPVKGTPTHESRDVSRTGATPLKDGLDALHIVSDPQQPEQDEDGISAQETASNVEPIQLQEFLNMTNVHFMELTTTKRRHTTAPGSAAKRLARRSGSNVLPTASITLDDCVAAGFCTVPMLELYQHSCRELKSYISEGRQVIRSIEAETYENNPPLFQEYATAPADIRVIMDNQFRNVKTHARLLSKATWYEWRMKLLEGLKDGLIRHVDEMKADDELLSKREELLNATVPALVEKYESLEQEATKLQQHVDEIENCDHNELRGAREQLSSIEDEIEAKKRELQQLQQEAQEKTASVEAGTEMRDEYMARIQDAEQVKEKCRGWSARDINELKTSVERIERETGWSIISASDSMLTMSYRDQLQVKFHPSAFATNKSNNAQKDNLPLELTSKSKTTSSIASLVLQSLQKHLATIEQFKISPANLLKFISTAWDRTLGLENEVRMLEFCGVTRLTLSDPKDVSLSLRARCTILGNTVGSSTPARKGSSAKHNGIKRIDVDFTVRTHINPGDQDAQEIGSLDFDMEVLATKIYGFGAGNKSGLPDDEMQSILGKELDGQSGTYQLGNGVWCKAVQQLTASVF
ncbi:hypothetical protein N7495_008334 [Penicillium taxi]|uniref:uncharacterized protein n=1 Tax=Penicillium taxi TaxID=168475 RepID=UPI0025457652|nr:uncharacterized protein N7495_008334 [Penicillium taxi]KAJ5888293.1 hypothetical protein N7495_008334 [Penicillium taxi]